MDTVVRLYRKGEVNPLSAEETISFLRILLVNSGMRVSTNSKLFVSVHGVLYDLAIVAEQPSR